jgi:hypothetical protein
VLFAFAVAVALIELAASDRRSPARADTTEKVDGIEDRIASAGLRKQTDGVGGSEPNAE